MLRNGEQLLLAVVIPLIVLIGALAAAHHFDLDARTPGRHARPRRARARGHVDQLHLAGDRHRVRAPLRRAEAARRRPRSPAPGCCRQGRRRCCSSRCCSSWCSAPSASRSAGHRRYRRGLLGVVAAASCSARPPSPGSACSSAGALRAEATLAVANLVYLLLLPAGRWCFPPTSYGAAGDRRWRCPAVRGARRRDARRARSTAACRRAAAACSRSGPSSGTVLTREDLHVGVRRRPDAARLVTRPDPPGRRAWMRRRRGRLARRRTCGIVVTGGVVRLTGSGPRLPDLATVHRQSSSRTARWASTAPSSSATGCSRSCSPSSRSRPSWWPGATGRAPRSSASRSCWRSGVPAQAVIGGITVLTDLNPWVVSLPPAGVAGDGRRRRDAARSGIGEGDGPPEPRSPPGSRGWSDRLRGWLRWCSTSAPSSPAAVRTPATRARRATASTPGRSASCTPTWCCCWSG